MMLRRSAKAAMVAVLAATIVNGGVRGITESQSPSHSSHHAAQAAERQEFWRIIAGGPQTHPGASDQALATDLAALIGPVDKSTTALPPGITSFIARSNAEYGGTTSAIGLDPFTNDQCQECGQLTPSFQQQLLTIKQGQVDVLIAQDAPVKGASSYSLTPFNLAVWASLLLLAFIFGAIAGVDIYLQNQSKRRTNQELRATYPRQMEQIRLADELLALDAPPNAEAARLRDQVLGLRNGLANEVTRQSSASVADDKGRLTQYQNRLEEGLRELQDGITANRITNHELGLDN